MTTVDKTQIVQGDSRELIQALEANTFDALITDPPFGTCVERDGYGRRQNYGGVGRQIENDSDLSVLSEVLALTARILKRNAWVAVFCSPKRHAETVKVIEEAGFPVVGEVIWDKASPGLGGGIRYQHETLLLARHGKAQGMSSLLSVLRYHVSRNNKASRHPHEKPVVFMREIVEYCTPKNGLVLDPFAGSGSTLLACEKSGRTGIGFELDPQWVLLAKQRLMSVETPLFS